MALNKINIKVKNMLCSSCIKLIEYRFENTSIKAKNINIGSVDFEFDDNKNSKEEIIEILAQIGFEVVKTREDQIVENVKNAVVELIHYLNNVDSIVRKSDYLVEKLGMSYQTLSKIFRKNENITLEKFIILNKIEKIKELILSKEFTLSEISFMMDYNSVQYLSSQFKKVSGYSVSEYRELDNPPRIPINEIGKKL